MSGMGGCASFCVEATQFGKLSEEPMWKSGAKNRSGLLVIILTSYVLLAGSARSKAQEAPSEERPYVEIPQSGVIKDKPFSATKYFRRIQITEDGKDKILAERHRVYLARDEVGRIRIQTSAGKWESVWLAPLTPDYPIQAITVVDPMNSHLTGWLIGESAAKGFVVFKLSGSQLKEALDLTAEIPLDRGLANVEKSHVKVEQLGEMQIEGVTASGIRYSTVLMHTVDGQPVRTRKIHEVWTSEELHLVIKVIDGDPRGEETVCGLEKISMQANPGVFEAPESYPATRWDENKSKNNWSSEIEQYITQFADWFVTPGEYEPEH
jgi:hypothetical protein